MINSLAIESLACVRGERMLFRDLSFHVAGGEIVGIEGPNGAGKTSLLRLVAGFLAPASGSIALATDRGTFADPDERGKFVGWLGHQDGLKSQLTVGEQLGFFAALYGGKAGDAALERVGLSRQRDLPCRFLSAGQRKRLALARLSIGERPLWLLDEPFSALDAEGRRLARAFIDDHAAKGGIALVATHESLGGRTLTLGTP